MTELERARSHLRECQRRLSYDRRCNYSWIPFSENLVLAALAWAWEEQEKRRMFGEQVAGLIGLPAAENLS